MKYRFNRLAVIVLATCTLVFSMGCSNPEPGPDKTVGGAVLGAAWGAGAGAVVGNQISGTPAGEGALVGAGFGALSGGFAGLAYDNIEDTQIEHEQALAGLKVQNAANAHQLAHLQQRMDKAITSDINPGIYQVFFDVDETSLKGGSVANLETIADALKSRTRGYYINVVGHADDGGDPKYNSSLSEARARSVSSYLAQRGINSDQIRVSSFGSLRPIATNNTDSGRQLNRRVDVYISTN